VSGKITLGRLNESIAQYLPQEVCGCEGSAPVPPLGPQKGGTQRGALRSAQRSVRGVSARHRERSGAAEVAAIAARGALQLFSPFKSHPLH